MKKNTLTVFTIILFITSFFYRVESKTNAKSFSGRVISVSDELIELKEGYKEIIIQISKNTVYVAKDGHEADSKIIKLCQYVKAEYSVNDGKNILVKYVVNKESDCIE